MFKSGLYDGRCALITGGGTGLGRTMANRLAELGAEIIILGRREDVLKQAAEEMEAAYGKRVRYASVDIRDAAAIDVALDSFWDDTPPDILVNNAAGNFTAKFEELSPRAVDAVLNIVVHGTAYMTLACGKRWIAAGTKATVLSITVTAAFTGAPYMVPSAMAKASVLAMTRSLAVEWGSKGIRFVAVAPGPFPTPGAWKNLFPRPGLGEHMENRPPVGRPGRHDEFADLIAYLLSDQAGFIHGEQIVIDGGNWLKRASAFSDLDVLTDEDWAEMKARPAAKK
ncbi:SDR family oxidoreductase [Granulosicoccus antarcticus]|uniref:Putative 2,4-dienoyl-CoA reductase n=1 Tax=Granulosicoccus antarcticus IMCC3135 TaxID=1192854 RepID=A0A2Z2NPT9_9GAMM|nr:SDR family oxidoreductase [Granulosicoccus antarcticus]ASJ73442.1 putative 2,4-dienoyl-CoA reductase [Granulosicoccus antarcticus IMCC3135]